MQEVEMREDCEGEYCKVMVTHERPTYSQEACRQQWWLVKNSLDGDLLDGSAFNEEKAKLNGYFGKKSNQFRKENQKKHVKARRRDEVNGVVKIRNAVSFVLKKLK